MNRSNLLLDLIISGLAAGISFAVYRWTGEVLWSMGILILFTIGFIWVHSRKE